MGPAPFTLEQADSPPRILPQRRRVKASLVMVFVWLTVVVLHVVPVTRWAVTGLAAGMVMYAGRLVCVSPFSPPPVLGAEVACGEGINFDGNPGSPLTVALGNSDSQPFPRVSILIPAKNEGSVIPALMESLSNLDYPADRLEIWAIDDASTDDTAAQLALWQEHLPQLHVHQRSPGATGGKSAALNEVLPRTFGDIIGVFDADALVPEDLLRRSLAIFQQKPSVVALQLRKAIANSDRNFWTRNQMAEMALDSYFQQQRRAIGGIGELRGNGQLVSRAALERAGGWNEDTITDDLDLTIRFHLAGGDVAFLADPAVQEEGVTRWKNLWPQRNRWAEGGYQRYLDYWPGIFNNDLGTAKTLDLALFFTIQYLLPMAAIPDLAMAIVHRHNVVLWPLSSVAISMSTIAMFQGLRRSHRLRGWKLIRTTAVGTIYMLHWVPVMVLTTARMCVRAKRLRWVKTLHVGSL
ncbi:glycosyltransferase family 2 protein [Synechococcus sp. PCC 7336]|uniref:glycosyltransferase n=1 Tax=Synechococcus sp. PCC 7336 TaxID=195250 RepID=UPI0003470AE8|nr:glycosyltransferase family 2 protein [Synechococcus sp. PCC 7336]